MKIDRSLPCVLLALTLTLPEITLAQATPTNDWIYPRPSHEDKLFVELKNGKTVTGNFYGISDTKLTLSNKNKNTGICLPPHSVAWDSDDGGSLRHSNC